MADFSPALGSALSLLQPADRKASALGLWAVRQSLAPGREVHLLGAPQSADALHLLARAELGAVLPKTHGFTRKFGEPGISDVWHCLCQGLGHLVQHGNISSLETGTASTSGARCLDATAQLRRLQLHCLRTRRNGWVHFRQPCIECTNHFLMVRCLSNCSC